MQDRITLTDVRRAFDQWRAGKTHPREKTPQHLHQLVQAIIPYYSKRQIMTSLAINAGQINRYASSTQDVGHITALNDLPSNEFIELPIQELPKIKHELTSSAALTITRRDGANWSLSKASIDVISESLRLFLQG